MMQYFSLDISGLSEIAKSFLMDKIEHVHEYSWEDGSHFIYIRGIGLEINILIKDMLDEIEGTAAPTGRIIDPDLVHRWSDATVRERFFKKYPGVNDVLL